MTSGEPLPSMLPRDTTDPSDSDQYIFLAALSIAIPSGKLTASSSPKSAVGFPVPSALATRILLKQSSAQYNFPSLKARPAGHPMLVVLLSSYKTVGVPVPFKFPTLIL